MPKWRGACDHRDNQNTTPRRDEKIDLRLTPQAKRTLVEAARVSHKSVSEYVLQSVLERADEVLADRQSFVIDKDRWEAFQTALNAPTSQNPKLTALLHRASPFDEQKS